MMKRDTTGDWLEMDRRTFLASLAVILVIAILASLYLLVVSRTAAQGRRIQYIRSSLAEQQRDTAHLQVSIARLSSVHGLIQRAVELGFVPATLDQIIFVRLADG